MRFLSEKTGRSECNLDGGRAFVGNQEEYFVDAEMAAKFLSITRKYLLKLSRLGVLPAHPLGIGCRRQWRYRISELAEWALAQHATGPDNVPGSPRAPKGRR